MKKALLLLLWLPAFASASTLEGDTIYFVSSEQIRGVVEWITKKGWGRWLPEGSDQYQVFSREYYWSPAYKYFDNPYYGRTLWEEVDRDSPIGSVMVTSELHRWESGSADDNPSYFAPREYIFQKIGLELCLTA